MKTKLGNAVVAVWSAEHRQELYVDRDGTRHERQDLAEILSDADAELLAKQVGGRVLDAFDDDDFSDE